ncbi:MAG: hypothetical protein EZS28_007018 [Streblomastix strix]|uniref:RNase H type-1 domain-containing protein n=1 Tax=Streblomastix strix TaxID=222440 RepID=A0A5J4WQT7_9EUKA|nr:MAG: hypothetical protein EZS28_007018 [Streblomastix strix]
MDNKREEIRDATKRLKVDQLTIQTDNQVAVMNLKRKASAAPLATTMKKICLNAMQLDLIIIPVHIRGLDNKKADTLSRLEIA